MAQTKQPLKVKYKTFTYRTQVKWVGGRAGILGSEGKPELRVASPPEFRGEAGTWTPEDLLVAAANACTMTTFLALADRAQIPLVEYVSEAEGMLEFVDGGYRFTKITLRPKIVVGTDAAVADAERALHDAHLNCLISNSIKAEVVIDAKIGSKTS